MYKPKPLTKKEWIMSGEGTRAMDMDKLMADAGKPEPQTVNRSKKADAIKPIPKMAGGGLLNFFKAIGSGKKDFTPEDMASYGARKIGGDESIEGEDNPFKAIRKLSSSYKNGGMVDRAAIRGKTKGKIC